MMPSDPAPVSTPWRLHRFEFALLGLLLPALLAFGAVVEIRSALQTHRRTDFGVYARAGWAARQSLNPYAIEDDRGWHYCYPVAFAVAMMPLADPPHGEPRDGCLPFGVSVAIWYWISIGCTALALDRFAAAVLPHEPRYSPRWWYARTGPFMVAIGAIGHTLARGQVNLLVVALLACALAALVRRRSFMAGMWLGAAVCIKIIPAFLALYFLVKRDFRGLAGLAIACGLGLFVLPAIVWGPEQSLVLNQQLLNVVIQPGTTGTGDSTRAVELTNATATDSQSVQSVVHNWLHPNLSARPASAAAGTRLLHWCVGVLATVAVLFAFRNLESNPPNELIRIGALAVVMLHLTPVSHMHYYAYALPLVCGIWLKGMQASPSRRIPNGVGLGTLIAWGILTAIPLFDGAFAEGLRAYGGGLFATYLLLRAAFMESDQSRISAGWPSRSPRISASAAVLMRSAPSSRAC